MNVTINCSALSNMYEFHEIIAQELHFPKYYGKNLDALYDCLTELKDDCAVTLCHVLPWFERLGNEAITAVRVMQDVSAENPHFQFHLGSSTPTAVGENPFSS